MSGALKLQHVELHTDAFEEMVECLTTVFGMAHLGEEDGTAYLGCGLDDEFDIAVTAGGTGLDHFAIRVPDAERIEAYERRLGEAGIDTERTDGDEPGQAHGLRFRLPSGIPMELVAPEPSTYHHAGDAHRADRNGVTPLDLHHINLVSPGLRADVEFLQSSLDFAVSEVRGTRSNWETAWLRRGDMHHDVAIIGVDPDESDAGLHHVALAMQDAAHLIRFVDRIAANGIDLEFGIGRHRAGDNLFAYFWAPGGHRFELAADMATVDATTPEYTQPPTSTWSPEVPESFYERGSGLAD